MRFGFLFVAVVLVSPVSSSAFSFTPGDYYATSNTAIEQYDSNGNQVASLPSPSGGDLRGLAFGPDGLLYVVQNATTPTGVPSVEALASDGSIVRSYLFTGTISGNISYGKIAFDPSGNSFYVGSGGAVYRFNTAGGNGSFFLNTDAFDVDVLPSGQLLVASRYALSVYSSTGALLSTFSSLSDPTGLTGGPNPSLYEVNGVAYDPKTNSTFVTMLGYCGAVCVSGILKLAGTTSTLTGYTPYTYGDDLFVTPDGRLLVGSRTLAPGVFTTADLGFQGQLGTTAAMFVTEFVPEPSTALLLSAGILGLARTRRRLALTA